MSFLATQLIGFGARRASAAANPIMAYGSSGADTSSTSTPTVAGLTIGTAAADRKVIAAIGWNSVGALTVSSATIGGVAATTIVQANSATGNAGSALIIAYVPTGTTATVVVTMSGSSARTAISTYYVTSLTSSTAHATGSATAASSGAISTSINVPANGFAIAIASTADGSAWTWTAPTENNDQYLASSSAHSAASASYTPAKTPLSVSTTCGTGSRSSLVAASWGN